MVSSSSSSLSLPVQLLRYVPSSSSSTRLVLSSVYRPSPYSAGRQIQPAKGLKSVTAAAGHDGDKGIDAATSLLHLVADEVAPELRIGIGGALHSPNKGRPGPPREGGGGSSKIHHAAAPTFARGPTPPGLPAKGSGGNGGSKH